MNSGAPQAPRYLYGMVSALGRTPVVGGCGLLVGVFDGFYFGIYAPLLL